MTQRRAGGSGLAGPEVSQGLTVGRGEESHSQGRLLLSSSSAGVGVRTPLQAAGLRCVSEDARPQSPALGVPRSVTGSGLGSRGRNGGGCPQGRPLGEPTAVAPLRSPRDGPAAAVPQGGSDDFAGGER